jgi:hypothetical protein
LGFGICFASLLAQGQPSSAPPPAAAEAPSGPAIDISGYWTPTMNEDGMERGGGSELHDYGGFALNEAGRLWALSYDPSRVTLRHHQCDAYVTPYQMRATGNFRAWEERDPHNQRLVAIHWWAQVTEGHRARLGAAHVPRLFNRQVRRQRARRHDHAPETGMAAAQRHA